MENDALVLLGATPDNFITYIIFSPFFSVNFDLASNIILKYIIISIIIILIAQYFRKK